MWTRAALIAIISGADANILEYWKDLSLQASHTAIVQIPREKGDDKEWKPLGRYISLDPHA
jgi:hypothetical protein